MGEQGEGEPPRSRRGMPKAYGEYAVPVGDRPTGDGGGDERGTEVEALREVEDDKKVSERGGECEREDGGEVGSERGGARGERRRRM